MSPSAPLTLLAGGPELARLVGQLVDRGEGCAIVGAGTVLDEADLPVEAGVAIEAIWTPSSADHGVAPDLVAGIDRAVDRSPAPRRLLAVLDDRDDVAAVAGALLQQGAVDGPASLDAVVVTVDAVRLTTRMASGQPVGSEAELDRLAVADRILVARSRDVTPEGLAVIGHVLRSINRTGPIIAPAIAPCCQDDLLDLDAWSGRPAVGRGPARPSPFLDDDAPSVVVCSAGESLDRDAFERWLDRVLVDHGDQLLRLQGVVATGDDRSRTQLRGARSRLVRSPERTGAEPDEDRSSVVALIGRRLPAADLQAQFAAACPF